MSLQQWNFFHQPSSRTSAVETISLRGLIIFTEYLEYVQSLNTDSVQSNSN